MTIPLKICPGCGAKGVTLIREYRDGRVVRTFCHKCPDDNLAGFRPLHYHVRIVAPDGTVTHDKKFGTKDEANDYAKANRQKEDVVMTQFLNKAANN